jgi:hypothetical protein
MPSRENRTDQAVYAVHFSLSQFIKVGSTTDRYPARYATRGLKAQFGIVEQGSVLWRMPGWQQHELWVQAHLAFALDFARGGYTRGSEWFETRGLTAQELVSLLNDIYGTVPLATRANTALAA